MPHALRNATLSDRDALEALISRSARAHGFSRFELMATLSGVRLYRAFGYVPQIPIHYELGAGLTIEFVPMSKRVEDR